ncbi:MAG: hypothetical protein R3E87_27025 [Burkholderiaceae bacterium]
MNADRRGEADDGSCFESALVGHLLEPVDQAPCDSAADWLPTWRETVSRHADTDAYTTAVLAAMRADRLAWVFFAGYQGALRRAFPDHLPAGRPRAAALCANEAGRKLSAIDTRLRDDGDVHRLDGAKSWVLSEVGELDAFVLARRADGPERGPGSQVLVRVSSTAPGVTIGPSRPQAFIPEMGHASMTLDSVAITPAQIIAGDGYADHTKPFRLREDLFIGGCTLAWLLAGARRRAWPTDWCQCALAAITQLGRCSMLPPNASETILLAAGALTTAAALTDQADALMTETDPASADRWRRDMPVRTIGREAAHARAGKAWQLAGF